MNHQPQNTTTKTKSQLLPTHKQVYKDIKVKQKTRNKEAKSKNGDIPTPEEMSAKKQNTMERKAHVPTTSTSKKFSVLTNHPDTDISEDESTQNNDTD